MKSSSLENVRAKSVSITIIDEWFKTLRCFEKIKHIEEI